jgi:protein SCO1/2
MMNPRFQRPLKVALVLLVAAVAACVGLLLANYQRPATFRAIDITGAPYADDFKLVDTEGRVRTMADYRGRVVMLFFGFTRCPDACPTALARFKEVMGLLGRDGDRMQVLFVSVDPERDTPELLSAYMRAFDKRFVALHGDLETTAATAKRFKVFYQKVPTKDGYTMDHSTSTYVYDPAGHLRLLVDARLDPEAIADDTRVLLREAR